MVRDSRVLTDQIEYFDVLTDDQKEAMRRLICANAKGGSLPEQVVDAEQMMRMLGVFPGQQDEAFDELPTEMNRWH